MEVNLNLIAEDVNQIKLKYKETLDILQELLQEINDTECISKINSKINYINDKINEEIFELLSKVQDVDNKHDYLMITDIDYRAKHRKINTNKCENCNSINIFNVDGIKTCIQCGSALGCNYVADYDDMEHYTKLINIYKRKTYVKTIIKSKLRDLSQINKENIIKESNRIFVEFNKSNLNQRKSFFSYSHMFRHILNKLELFDYVDKFKPLKTKHTLSANEEFYNKL